eukprot:SAG11_NODE_567_length_8488_cov_4.292764_3_plen_149_part_00
MLWRYYPDHPNLLECHFDAATLVAAAQLGNIDVGAWCAWYPLLSSFSSSFLLRDSACVTRTSTTFTTLIVSVCMIVTRVSKPRFGREGTGITYFGKNTSPSSRTMLNLHHWAEEANKSQNDDETPVGGPVFQRMGNVPRLEVRSGCTS